MGQDRLYPAGGYGPYRQADERQPAVPGVLYVPRRDRFGAAGYPREYQ